MSPTRTKLMNWLNSGVLGFSNLVLLAFYIVTTQTTADATQLGLNNIVFSVALLHVVYMAFYYFYIRSSRPKFGSLIGLIIASGNIAYMALLTGGFSSPFYALWLVAVVASSIYNKTAILLYLLTTTGYYAGLIILDQAEPNILYLAVALAAGLIAFWLHSLKTESRSLIIRPKNDELSMLLEHRSAAKDL